MRPRSPKQPGFAIRVRLLKLREHRPCRSQRGNIVTARYQAIVGRKVCSERKETVWNQKSQGRGGRLRTGCGNAIYAWGD